MRDDQWRGGMAVLLAAFVVEVVWLWSLGCVNSAIFVAVFGAVPAAFGFFARRRL